MRSSGVLGSDILKNEITFVFIREKEMTHRGKGDVKTRQRLGVLSINQDTKDCQQPSRN